MQCRCHEGPRACDRPGHHYNHPTVPIRRQPNRDLERLRAFASDVSKASDVVGLAAVFRILGR